MEALRGAGVRHEVLMDFNPAQEDLQVQRLRLETRQGDDGRFLHPALERRGAPARAAHRLLKGDGGHG